MTLPQHQDDILYTGDARFTTSSGNSDLKGDRDNIQHNGSEPDTDHSYEKPMDQRWRSCNLEHKKKEKQSTIEWL